MDIRKVKKLIELLEESGIAEIEITEGEESVRISRYGNHVPGTTQVMAPPVMAAPPAAAPLAPASAPAPGQEIPAGHQVKAPMVGTFYRSSAPGAKPFVEVGDSVKLGQAVCIVEAMKILNEIESEIDGVVKQVLVENGQPVEYGQALFELE